MFQNINLGDIVSDRLSALRRLQDNPNDVQAINTCYKANKAVSTERPRGGIAQYSHALVFSIIIIIIINLF